VKAGSRFPQTWWPVALYACVILTATSIPSDRLALVGDLAVSDRWAHMLLYVPLAMLVFSRLRHVYSALPLPYLAVATVLLCTAFGVLDELHQLFIPGRFCDAADVAADMAGALVGAGASLLLLRLRIRPRYDAYMQASKSQQHKR
jgi:hypothetical protein